MDIEFLETVTKEQIHKLSDTAKEIWLEYYPGIITAAQADYMIKKYQSAEVIAQQISIDGYKYFLVLSDKQILGYIAVKPESDKLFLSKLYLLNEFRGKGYFNGILSFAERLAVKNGLSSLYLTVNKHNSNSIAVYQKKGFVITDEIVTDIGSGYVMDDYVMEKKVLNTL